MVQAVLRGYMDEQEEEYRYSQEESLWTQLDRQAEIEEASGE